MKWWSLNPPKWKVCFCSSSCISCSSSSSRFWSSLLAHLVSVMRMFVNEGNFFGNPLEIVTPILRFLLFLLGLFLLFSFSSYSSFSCQSHFTRAMSDCKEIEEEAPKFFEDLLKDSDEATKLQALLVILTFVEKVSLLLCIYCWSSASFFMYGFFWLFWCLFSVCFIFCASLLLLSSSSSSSFYHTGTERQEKHRQSQSNDRDV